MKVLNYLTVLSIMMTVAFSSITKDEAKEYVLNTLFDGAETKTHIYQTKQPVSNADGLQIWDKKLISSYESSYVFFVDIYPLAGWAHPCAYIFVDEENEENYEVINEMLPPSRLDLFESVTVIHPQIQSISGIDLPRTEPRTSEPDSSQYAVLIAGGFAPYENDSTLFNSIRYMNDLSLVYSTLTQEYGYLPENIFVFANDSTLDNCYGYPEEWYFETWANPTFENCIDLDNDGVYDVDFPATKVDLRNLFNDLSNNLDETDQLFIYVTDHGYVDTVSTDHHQQIFYLWDIDEPYYEVNYETEVVHDDTLSLWLKDIDVSQISVVMQQCYSGGFIEELLDTTGVKCKNRVITTSSDTSTFSWGEIWESASFNYELNEDIDFGYRPLRSWFEEFTYYWVASQREYYPKEIVDSFYVYLYEPPYYPGGWYDSYLPLPWDIGKSLLDYHQPDSHAVHINFPNYDPLQTSDLNNDNSVSMQESFSYQLYHNTYAQDTLGGIFDVHPYWLEYYCSLFPNFYGCSEEALQDYPQFESTSSLMANNLTLSGLAGKLAQDETINTNVLIGGTLTVPEGITLTIEPGVIVNFTPNGKIVVDGNLVAIGTQEDTITFKPAWRTTDKTWSGINVTGGQIELEYAEIYNAKFTGVSLSHNSTGWLKNSHIHSNPVGMRLSYVNNEFVIKDNIISDNTSFGINLRHSSPDIIDNDIYGNNYIGILMMSGSNSVVKGNHIYNNGVMTTSSLASGINMVSSSPELITSINGVPFNYPVNNEIDNHTTGIFVAFMGSPNLGVYSENNYTINGGLNHFHNNETSLNRSYAGPYWPDEPSPRNYQTIFAEVNYWYSGLSEEAEPNNISGSRISITPTAPSVIEIVAEEDEIRLLRDGLILEQKGELPQARSKYTEYLQTDPDEEGIITALGGINRTYEKENDIESLISELEYWKEVGNNKAISTIAQTQLIWAYKSINADEQAIETVEDLIAEYEGTDLEPYYILELALLLEESDGALLFRTNPDNPTANQILEQGISKVYTVYSESNVAELFRLLYGGGSQITTETNSQLLNQYTLLNAYPNPFNPVTTIQYEIPEQSQITLKVFDLHGRVIAELENKTISGGKYQSLWDGTDKTGRQVATGIYFYQLTTISSESGKVFTQSNKMLLLK